MDRLLTALADDNLCINPVTYKGNHEYRKAIKEEYGTAETLEQKLNDEEKKHELQACKHTIGLFALLTI